MKLSDFDFDLPQDLIATRPARPRSASRMLVATPDQITDAHAGSIRAENRRDAFDVVLGARFVVRLPA